MQILIKDSWKVNLWALFSADPGKDDPVKMPLTMEAVAAEIQTALEMERAVGDALWVRVYYPEDGSHMMLKWRLETCDGCEEAEEYSYGWCPDHTWWTEEGDGDQAREAAIRHGVPTWLVRAIDKHNDGNLHMG